MDSGGGVSHTVHRYEGYALPHMTIPARVSFMITAEREIVRDVKEKPCYFALDYDTELKSTVEIDKEKTPALSQTETSSLSALHVSIAWKCSSSQVWPVKKPTESTTLLSWSATLTSARICTLMSCCQAARSCPERLFVERMTNETLDPSTMKLKDERRCWTFPLCVFFQPSVIGKEASGVHDTSYRIDIRKNLYANVAPSGGTTMFKGFWTGFWTHDNVTDGVASFHNEDQGDCSHLVWIGGPFLTSFSADVDLEGRVQWTQPFCCPQCVRELTFFFLGKTDPVSQLSLAVLFFFTVLTSLPHRVHPTKKDSPWRQLSLVSDEEVISLSHAKVFVFFRILCSVLERWIRTQHQILFGKKSWVGSKIHHNTQFWTQLTESRWKSKGIFSRIHHIAARRRSPRVHEQNERPSQFQGRIICMSMLNDIIWISEDNERECVANATLATLFAKRFPAGRWSFLGHGSETKWYSTYIDRPQGEWDRVAELMMIKFRESGHPVFRATSPVSRGTLKSKGGVKLSIHFCADGDTLEIDCSAIISDNQLSICGAVSELCDEYSACQARTVRPVLARQSDPLFEPARLLITTPPPSTEVLAQENLLQKYKERVDRLSQQDRW